MTSTPANASSASETPFSVPDPEYDAVVIGSGFGGSINALRLAEAGKSVLVLERGKRYRPGEFPREVRDINSLLWRYPRQPQSRGLYEVRFFKALAAVVASGVGGGSLIYANIHVRPDPAAFADERWPNGFSRPLLDPYYDKVASQLGLSPLPADIALPKRDAYRAAALRLGREVFDPDMAVRWKGPAEEGREPCRLVAECEFGCQYGAKNTLDLNYLSQAERGGARIQPNSLVTRITPEKGGYLVQYTDLLSGSENRIRASRVVVAAGTLGTNELLLRCRDVFQTLPLLSKNLGRGYSCNGDFLGSIQNSQADLQPWHGPDVTSIIRYWESPPEFTMAAPTFNQPVMDVLASHGQISGNLLRPLLKPLWPSLQRLTPLALKKGAFSRPSKIPGPQAGPSSRMTNLFAIGRDNAGGILHLTKKGLDLKWDFEKENALLIRKMKEAMQEVAGVYGGTFSPLVTWNLFRRTLSFHSLGGCALADTPEKGVVSGEGEVFHYPGLFVADGSVIPTSLGFHPAMTISAVAEKIAAGVVRSF